jgi:hypothetical protein
MDAQVVDGRRQQAIDSMCLLTPACPDLCRFSQFNRQERQERQEMAFFTGGSCVLDYLQIDRIRKRARIVLPDLFSILH